MVPSFWRRMAQVGSVEEAWGDAPGRLVGLDGELDVDGTEDGEDIGLQDRNENLEQGHHDHGRAGQEADRRGCLKVQEQAGGAEEGHAEQHVPGDHVAQQTQRERHRPHNEVREELDGGDEQIHHLGQARREELGGEEVPDPLLPDAGADEGDVGQGGEHHGDGHHRGGGDVEAGDDAGEVHGEHAQEEGSQQRGEAAAVLVAQEREGHIAAHEVGDDLQQGLAAPGDDLDPAGDRSRRQAQGNRHDNADEGEPVELQESPLTEDRDGEEVLSTGLLKLVALRDGEGGHRGLRDHRNQDDQEPPVPQRLDERLGVSRPRHGDVVGCRAVLGDGVGGQEILPMSLTLQGLPDRPADHRPC